MQYSVEDLSPVKKNVQVTVPAQEVGDILKSTLERYRSNLTLKGFRRGKAPLGLVEKQFQREVYGEAANALVDANIKEILKETKFIPVSRIELDGGKLERDKDFEYSMSFEIMPDIELPPYEGLAVEQEEAVVAEDDVDQVLARLSSSRARPVPLTEDRQAADGDFVSVNFAGFEEDGTPLEAVKGDKLTATLGQGQTLPDFEAIIKTLKKGESGQGPVTFPDDYFNKEMAGKSITMKVTLDELSASVPPELDDAFAKDVAGFETLEELKDSIRKSYMDARVEAAKAGAKDKLLEQLVEKADFEVPEVMLENNVNTAVRNMQQQIAGMGGTMENMGATPEALREEVLPDALKRTREEVLLLAIARKQELGVSDAEAQMQISRMARQSGQDFTQLVDYFNQNGMMDALKERILQDKALDYVYDKARVTMVEPAGEDQAETAAKTKKTAKKAKTAQAGDQDQSAADSPADKQKKEAEDAAPKAEKKPRAKKAKADEPASE